MRKIQKLVESLKSQSMTKAKLEVQTQDLKETVSENSIQMRIKFTMSTVSL